MKGYAFLLVSLLSLGGCLFEKTNDVAYYEKYKSERDAKLAECANNPGELSKSANCVNAREAKHRSVMDSSNTGMPGIK